MNQVVWFPRGSIPPMSNTDRQRRFRAEHPGYYQRLHARQRAECKARLAARAEAARAAVSIPSLLDRVRAQPLMLPAPVEELIFPALQEREHALLKSPQT
jgi:hypothetical protein